jgi:hypothetical protein
MPFLLSSNGTREQVEVGGFGLAHVYVEYRVMSPVMKMCMSNINRLFGIARGISHIGFCPVITTNSPVHCASCVPDVTILRLISL